MKKLNSYEVSCLIDEIEQDVRYKYDLDLCFVILT